jgi:hypothetical protein
MTNQAGGIGSTVVAFVGSVASFPVRAGCGIVGVRVILNGASAHKMRVFLKPGRLILCPESDTERSSKTVPGALLADIWMRIREKLRLKEQ